MIKDGSLEENRSEFTFWTLSGTRNPIKLSLRAMTIIGLVAIVKAG